MTGAAATAPDTMHVVDAIELELQARDLIADIERRLTHGEATVKPPGKLDGTEGRLSRHDSMLHHEMQPRPGCVGNVIG